MNRYIGLDIGGTKFLVANADENGTIIKRVQNSSPAELDEGLQLLYNMISEVHGNEPAKGIGVAIGGPLDWKAGVVSPLHQPQWRHVPLKKILEEKYHCPAYIDVDTNIAALGEYRLTNEHCGRFLYLTLSTGMGGGFIVNGSLYRGSDGSHPEPAHLSINHRCSHPENLHCECGAPDCLEALVSGNGIRRIYGKPARELNQSEWDEVAYNLGQGLRSLSTLYCPDVISIGGGIAFARGECLLKPAEEVMKKHLTLIRPPEIRVSQLGYDTALLGTISVAMHGL